jgi:hypothetical protein
MKTSYEKMESIWNEVFTKKNNFITFFGTNNHINSDANSVIKKQQNCYLKIGNKIFDYNFLIMRKQN